jgi:hypothetical protein
MATDCAELLAAGRFLEALGGHSRTLAHGARASFAASSRLHTTQWIVGLERRGVPLPPSAQNRRQTSNTMAATTKTTTPISTSTAMFMLGIVAKKEVGERYYRRGLRSRVLRGHSQTLAHSGTPRLLLALTVTRTPPSLRPRAPSRGQSLSGRLSAANEYRTR